MRPARVMAAWLAAFVIGTLFGACSDGAQQASPEADPLSALPAHASPPHTLVVGLTPGDGPAASVERTRPLARYLQGRLHMAVQLRAASSYGELSDLVRSGGAQVALFAPADWVDQRHRLPVVPIASATRNGAPTYVGYLVVADAHRFPTLGSLRGARVAWVDPASAGGYQFPRALLRFRGYDPDHFFGGEVFAGDHPAALRKVLDGEVDVAAVASSFIDQGMAETLPGADRVTTVAKTARIPYDCVVVRRDLNRSLARRLRTALLDFADDEQAVHALKSLSGIDGFLPVARGRYTGVARVLQLNSGR